MPVKIEMASRSCALMPAADLDFRGLYNLSVAQAVTRVARTAGHSL
jgi:hypothetical protein